MYPLALLAFRLYGWQGFNGIFAPSKNASQFFTRFAYGFNRILSADTIGCRLVASWLQVGCKFGCADGSSLNTSCAFLRPKSNHLVSVIGLSTRLCSLSSASIASCLLIKSSIHCATPFFIILEQPLLDLNQRKMQRSKPCALPLGEGAIDGSSKDRKIVSSLHRIVSDPNSVSASSHLTVNSSPSE